MAFLSGCTQKATNAAPAAVDKTADKAVGKAADMTVRTASGTVPAPAQPARANQIRGKVLETFGSGGYTYLRVATPAGEEWIAVGEVPVEKGQIVTVDAQLTMENFESTSLGRKFPRIVFGSMSSATSPDAAVSGSPKDHMKAADPGPIKVDKAEGGRTVADVWTTRASLDGKQVIVRGQVVKSLSGIMGKNWLHLRDGSGTPEKGDHDLTVTSNGTARVGDIVTVRGTVRLDKDFGAGYVYPVIVEDARIE